MSKIRPILHDTFNLGLHLDDAYDTLKLKRAQIPENKNFQNLAATIDSILINKIFNSIEEMEASTGNLQNEIALVYSSEVSETTLITQLKNCPELVKIPKSVLSKMTKKTSLSLSAEYTDDEDVTQEWTYTLEIPDYAIGGKSIFRDFEEKNNNPLPTCEYFIDVFGNDDLTSINKINYTLGFWMAYPGSEMYDIQYGYSYHTFVYELEHFDDNFFYLIPTEESTPFQSWDMSSPFVFFNDYGLIFVPSYVSSSSKYWEDFLDNIIESTGINDWDQKITIREQISSIVQTNLIRENFIIPDILDPFINEEIHDFKGLFLYDGNQWKILPFQLDCDKKYVGSSFFSNQGVQIGTLFKTENLSREELQDKMNIRQTLIENINTSNITDFSYFYRNSDWFSYPQIDTSNGINMQGMFRGARCSNLVDYNTSKVKDMSDMFHGCYNFTQLPNFDVSEVINAENMFGGCYNLPILDFQYWNFASLKNATGMFEYTNIMDIKNLNIGGLENASSMFSSCYSLINVSFLNTNNLKNMCWMFDDCYNLKEISNLDTHNVVNMRFSFSSCNNLKTVPNFNTSNVTDMSWTFSSCDNLSTIPNFDTSNVINMEGIFSDCQNLKELPNWDLSGVQNLSHAFFNVPFYSLNSIPNYDTSRVTDMSYTLSKTGINFIPKWNTSRVINMNGLFSNCDLQEVSNFNTDNVISMHSTFANCYSLKNISNFNTSKVTDMSLMFQNCQGIYTIPNFDMQNVQNIDGIFTDDSQLTTLPLLNWSSVTYIGTEEMDWRGASGNPFYNCSNLTDVGGFLNLGANFLNNYQENIGLNLQPCGNLTHDSLLNIFNNLGILNVSYNCPIYLNENSLNLLTRAEQKIVIKKGWKLDGFVPDFTIYYELLNNYQGKNEYSEIPTIINLHNDLINLNQQNAIINLDFKYMQGNITNLNNICNNLTQLQQISFDNCINVTDIENIFYNCNNLIEVNKMLNLGNNFNSSSSINARTLNLTMANLTNTSIVNLFSSLGKPSVEAHINLGNSNLEKLQDTEKSIAARKGWTVDGFEWTSSDFRDFVTINLNSNGGAYGFAEDSDDNGDYYKNTNQRQSSTTSQMSIEITQAAINKFGTSITLDCYYSSEDVSYDYLLIQKNDTQIGKYGGGEDWLHQEVQISDLQAGDIIYISYRKDGSVDGGQDGVKIYLPKV